MQRTLLVSFFVGGLASAQGRPIAVQGAVDTELGPLIEAVGSPEPRLIDGFSFWEGTIAGARVVVSRTEVGMVQAAISTTILVREFAPRVIINQGTAGAADPDLNVGDIVLSTATLPYGALRTAPRERGAGVDLDGWEILPRRVREGTERRSYERFEADPELLAIAKGTPYERGRLVEGVVGSGDQWNREQDKLLWAHERLGIASEDMESAAVHQTAQIYGVPFLALRIISNSEYHDPEFRRELGGTCAEFAVALVEEIVRHESRAVASRLTRARTADGTFISWREHIIDDEAVGGVAIRGSDGLAMGDLDLDGNEDIVSVHESDTEYDGVAEGHIRIAFGTENPNRWELATLATGPEAGAAEDVAIGDVNGDGYPDVVAACELAHLVYFQNPGERVRTARWERLIPEKTTGRGSFIRVFLADLNGDGRPEVVTPNKGAQNPDWENLVPTPISWFEIAGDPLEDGAWREHELARLPWPINAQPVDLDGDGDLDIVGGSVAEERILWFENRGHVDGVELHEHPIELNRSRVNGFNMDFVDLSGDGRLDIIVGEADRVLGRDLVWLEAPAARDARWWLHRIGGYGPDQLVGLVAADIDDDGDMDVMTGGYSRGPRDRDGDVTAFSPLGRLAWFENPGDASSQWARHDISRRKRGMFDKFVPRDMDGDGDVDFVSTRGNSVPHDGVFWLEQVRTEAPVPAFERARQEDSKEMPLPVGR